MGGSMMPALRSAQMRMPGRATSISPTPSFVDLNRRGAAVHRAPLATSPIVRWGLLLCEDPRADAALLRLLASALPLRGLASGLLRSGLRLRL